MTEMTALHDVEQTLEAARITGHPAYPAYEPSGIEWLDTLPEHWTLKRLKFVTDLNPSPTEIREIDGNDEVSFVPMDAVNEFGGLRLDQTRLLEDVRSGFTYFRDGDVVVAKITPCFENGKGSIAYNLVNGTGFGTTELHVIRPQQSLDVRFLFYLTISHPFRKLGASEMYGAGGQKRVPYEFVRDFRTPVPPEDEQQAIARFLDEQTKKIDDLINAKRKLLKLLKEKRQAVITHAVTKGLDPNAKLKPSGIDWLGDVPEQWTPVPLKYRMRFVNGMAFKPNEWTSEGVPIIRIDNLNGSETFNRYDGDVERRYHVHRGDLLFGWSGNRGTSFGPFIWWRDGLHYLNQHIFKITNTHDDPKWLYWALLAVTKFIEEEAHGIIGMVHVTKARLGAFRIPVPPRDEQHEIATFLDEQTGRIDSVIQEANNAIERLTEYRSALISAAVTGKIDVRGGSA